MSMPIVPPFAVTGSYQNSQYATGTYTQGGSQVFSHLVSPPSTGVTAETAADTAAHAKGFSSYSARNEVQVITITGSPAGGTFGLEWGDKVTTDIVYNASASTVQSALRALADMPAPTGGTQEVQRVTITGAPAGGTFTLTYSGQTTAGIAWNAVAADVQAALIALSNLAPGDVTVTGGPAPASFFTVTFGGTLAYTDVAALTASAASLTGGTSPAVTITTPTAGVPQSQNIAVSGSSGGPYTVTFSNVLAGENVAQIAATNVALTGGTDPDVTVSTSAGGRATFYNQALQNAHQQYDGMRNQADSSGGNHF